MRGTWDDVNRRLVGSLLALDLEDKLIIRERVARPRRRLFGRTPAAPPHRWAAVTAQQSLLLAECVGAERHGGPWPVDEATEARLKRSGWQPPWSDEFAEYTLERPLIQAPEVAVAVARALRDLGCQVEDLEVELTREEPDPGDYGGEAW